MFQEFNIDLFEMVWNVVLFSCGLFGKVLKFEYIEKVLKDLFFWDKCNNWIMLFLGGMKCWVMIVKVLFYEF